MYKKHGHQHGCGWHHAVWPLPAVSTNFGIVYSLQLSAVRPSLFPTGHRCAVFQLTRCQRAEERTLELGLAQFPCVNHFSSSHLYSFC